MTLGTLLSQLESERDIAGFLEGSGDVLLLRRVAECASTFDETPEEYAVFALRRFSSQASSDDWLALMTAMEKSARPAQAAIATMIDWAIRADQPAANSVRCEHGHDHS